MHIEHEKTWREEQLMRTSNNLKEMVYSGVYSKLLSCEYNPGDVITEGRLMSEFNCSKTPVREALSSLCNEGVITSIPRFGYVIEAISPDEVRDMLKFRLCIEKGFIKKAFPFFSDEQIDQLDAIDRELQSSKNESWSQWELHWELNVKFHVTMLSFCGNKYAVEMLEKCMQRLKRAYAQFYREINSTNMDYASQKTRLDTRNHLRILSALKAKNEAELMEYLELDIMDFGGIRIKRDEIVLI